MSEAVAGDLVSSFEHGRKVADAVLYEGYVLYPYRATAPKNRLRWQFGVLVPPRYGAEPSWQRTECVVEGTDGDLHLVLRFLQLQLRSVERPDDDGAWVPVPTLDCGDHDVLPFEEGVEHCLEVVLSLRTVLERPASVTVGVPGALEVENVETPVGPGRVRRERSPLSGNIVVSSERVTGPGKAPAVRLRVVIENVAEWADRTATRAEALRHSIIGAHVLLGLTDAWFVSLLEPPAWAEAAVDGCSNRHTYPVLLGRPGSRDAMLSSPVLMYDHPQIAPESPGDLYDATEIDEILTLRTLTLTDAEKREARATDPRAAAIIDRVEAMTPEVMTGLHGTFRVNRNLPDVDEASLATGGRGEQGSFAKGSRVRLKPKRSTDAQDMFLADRVGVVDRTIFDVDGTVFVTVTVEDDPAAELHEWYGRFLYFRPEELEAIPEDV